MPKKPYTEIKGVFREEEPCEWRAHGANGVEYVTNVQKVEGGWTCDVLRFESKADFAIYLQTIK